MCQLLKCKIILYAIIFLYGKDNPDLIDKVFSSFFHHALDKMRRGKIITAERVFRVGSRLFRKACFRNKYIYCITTDNCSGYLISFYLSEGKVEKLNKLLQENYIYYQGEYYSINLNDDVVARLIKLDRNTAYEFGYEFIYNENLVRTLQEIKANRRVRV